jgi:hypothetical protein
LVAAALTACTPVGARAPAPRAAAEEPVPNLVLARGERLAETKRRLRAGDASLRPAYAALLRAADSALTVGPFTVVQKERLPPSGDRHDYLSLAPYWWPDSTKPGGVPYVRRDGEMNPETRVDHDGLRFQAMTGAVETLALAYYLSGEARYAARAATLLRVWFLDPATRMNPHLRYAQAIPGVTEGRGIGIIDTRHLPQLADAIQLLDGSPAWARRDRDQVAAWLRAYLDWLRTSEHGREERAAQNNHGTWYDAQVAALALHVGDTSLARQVLAGSAMRRIAAQIAPDGRQPLELARTRPLHYSVFNLDAFTQLAEMARHAGADIWGYAAPNGASLRGALRYVARFADPTVARPNPEVVPVGPEEFVVPLRRGAVALGDAALEGALERLPPELTRTHRSHLLYPAGAAATAMTAARALDTLVDRALGFAATRLRRSATSLDPRDGYPRFTRADGSWEQRPAAQWTSGFFPGMLWYVYQLTRDPEWRALAERWTAGIEGVKSTKTTHDLGFMLFNSFGHGYLLTGNPHYRDVVLEGSASLATRYNPTVGAIKSWDTEGGTDARRTWKFPVIVDNLMNLEMLSWAARNGGDPAWARLAERHALTSARVHVRPNGSTAHVALFDPGTGALERTVTWQGHTDTSTWSRGQAWAIQGFTTAFGRTGRAELLDAAQRTADYFIGHLPPDGVPYWDFQHPNIPNVERDASAAAIAASGLFDLARRSTGAAAERYRASAERILASLIAGYTTAGTPSAAVLQHAVGQRPQGVEIDVGLVYADYYFVEALLRYRGIYRE